MAMRIEGPVQKPTVDLMRNLVLLVWACRDLDCDPECVMAHVPTRYRGMATLEQILANDKRALRKLEGRGITVAEYNDMVAPLLEQLGHPDRIRFAGRAANHVSFGLEVLQKRVAGSWLGKLLLNPFMLYNELPKGSATWNTNKVWRVVRTNGSSVMLFCTYQIEHIMDDLLSLMYLIPGMNEEFPRLVLPKRAPLAQVQSLLIAAPVDDVISRLLPNQMHNFSMRGNTLRWNGREIGERVWILKDQHGEYSGARYSTTEHPNALVGIRIAADVCTPSTTTSEELPLLREGMIFQVLSSTTIPYGDEAAKNCLRWNHSTISVNWKRSTIREMIAAKLGHGDKLLEEDLTDELEAVAERRRLHRAEEELVTAEGQLRATMAVLGLNFPTRQIGLRVIESGEIFPGKRLVTVPGFAVYLDMVGSEQLTKQLEALFPTLPPSPHSHASPREVDNWRVQLRQRVEEFEVDHEGLATELVHILADDRPANSRELWVLVTQRFINRLTELAATHGLWVYQYMNDGFVIVGTNAFGDIGKLETSKMNMGDIFANIVRCCRAVHQLAWDMLGRQLRIGIDFGQMAWVAHERAHRIDSGGDPTKLAARVEAGAIPGHTFVTMAARELAPESFHFGPEMAIRTKHGDRIPCHAVLSGSLPHDGTQENSSDSGIVVLKKRPPNAG